MPLVTNPGAFWYNQFMRDKRIGVFDSGFGGLNTLKSIVRALPAYDYLYLGDAARAPYGGRSQKAIYQFTRQAVDFLFRNNCELIVVACNTASSEALRKIQREYLPKHYPGRRVLGVLIPAAEVAAQKTRNNRIGVMATQATVGSRAFIREAGKLGPRIRVFQKACPLLVPIVEAGQQDAASTKRILQSYLAPLTKQKIDTLILGCTHYGILEKQIKRIVGRKTMVVSEAEAVPKNLKAYLKKHKEIETKLRKNRTVQFYTTGFAGRFKTLGSKFFGQNINVTKVKIS